MLYAAKVSRIYTITVEARKSACFNPCFESSLTAVTDAIVKAGR